jgi:hypothetical protein
MQSPTFSSILDRPSNSIEKPKPLPVGTYLAMTKGLPREDKSAKKQTPFVEFSMQLLQAADDVDQEALQAVLGSKALNEITMKNTFYLTDDAAWRLQKFLEADLGIEGGDVSLRQMISSSPGRQCLVSIKHEASQDGTSVFARIDGTAPVGE